MEIWIDFVSHLFNVTKQSKIGHGPDIAKYFTRVHNFFYNCVEEILLYSEIWVAV